jgi:hypothetical protein
MTATTDVVDLVQRWAAAEQGNDAQALEGMLAARPADRWMLANAHIGMLQAAAGPPSQ